MSYIHVKLLNGFHEILTYAVPKHWETSDLIGALVQVPLQKRLEQAIVIDCVQTLKEKPIYTIKEAHARDQLPEDRLYTQFIKKLSAYYALEPLMLYKRVRQFLGERDSKLDDLDELVTAPSAVNLTEEQQAIVNSIVPSIKTSSYGPQVIHGVTGSGKTEIYKKLITAAYIEKKTTLLLLPEVSLALQFTKLLKTQLFEIPIYSFHSATSIKEKKLLWKQLQQEKPALIIGVHLPILLPLPKLGLIIIDEEHDVGYQEKKYPRINTKEAALMRAQLYTIPIVLGSATPSIATLHQVKTRGWKLHQLHKRFAGAFPKIQIVQLNTRIKRDTFWISKELHAALATCLLRKEQAIIFLNRRGYSFFVQCGACAFIFSCNKCSVSLTLHNNNTLVCHYCGHIQKVPANCPSCKVSEKDFIKKGIGTQQVVSMLEKLFPQAKIGRADLDASSNKTKWQKTLTDFQAGDLDILVGTQTITKGYHFPRVTLVGILWADINLNFPVYNAAETTLQQLIQVAGRAGRVQPDSRVIVQTLVEHPVYQFLSEVDYAQFYEYEIAYRQQTQYPPCVRFAELELRNTDEHILIHEADECADFLLSIIQKNKLNVTVLGPAQPPVHKIKNIFMRKIYLKSDTIAQIISLYRAAQQKRFTSSILFTPNPLN